MIGYTLQQLPVLSSIAREFGVFDHWFSEVPSQTFMNRSFWTAATSSGLVVNSPVRKWFTDNNAETIFERLEQHGRTWKVYVMEPMCLSFTGVIHYPRLKDWLATHFVRFSEFEKDAAAGTLPDFALIEPDMIAGHGDYRPAFGRSFFGGNVDIGLDAPSAMLGGEAFLERIFNAYRSATSPSGTNVWDTTLLTWATVAAQPVPAWAIDYTALGKALGHLGKDIGSGIIEHAREMGLQLIVEVIRDAAFLYFPQLAPGWRTR